MWWWELRTSLARHRECPYPARRLIKKRFISDVLGSRPSTGGSVIARDSGVWVLSRDAINHISTIQARSPYRRRIHHVNRHFCRNHRHPGLWLVACSEMAVGIGVTGRGAAAPGTLSRQTHAHVKPCVGDPNGLSEIDAGSYGSIWQIGRGTHRWTAPSKLNALGEMKHAALLKNIRVHWTVKFTGREIK